MRRAQLKEWFLTFLQHHKCCSNGEDVHALTEAFSRELPGVLVEDDYAMHMDEMLGMHAVYLEAQQQGATTRLKDDRREDGKEKIEHIVEQTSVQEMRDRVADLRIAVEERQDLRCPECGTAPPAKQCKMGCATRKFK